MANTSDLIRIGFDVESGMKKALAEIEKGNADIQKKVDGNHIEYKISGDDSQLKSLISEISKLKPHALTVDFDDSDFRKRLGDIESLTVNKAKSIGDNFANSISKEIQNSNIESTLQNILGNGVKINKTQIAKKIGELRTEIRNGLGENNVNLSSILGDSSQLEKYISMYREMATLSEYIEHNMGGRKLAKVADLNSLENISKEITTLFSSADFSTVTAKINEEFSSSFEKVREFLYQMSNIGTGSFGDLTNITNILNSQIDSVDKNIKELEGDISSLGNRANSIRELSSAITENDIDYKTDKYQKLISAIKEYINLGGKIKDAGTFSIGNLKNKSLSDLWDFLGQSNQLKENTKVQQFMEQMISQREKLSNILGGITSIGNPLDSSVADTGRIINNQSEAFHNMSIVGTQSIETIIQKLNELKSIIIEISDMKLLPEITSEEMLSLKNSFSKINDYLREVSNVTLLPELDKNFNDILKQKINNLGSYELKINPVVTDDSALKKANENTLKAVSKKNVASSEETTVVKNNPVVSSPTIPDYSVNIEQLSNLEKTVELVKQAFYNMSTAISETKIANEIAIQKEISDINNLFTSLDAGIEKYKSFIEIANNANLNLNATSKNEDMNSIKQTESATVEAIQAKKDFATANEAVQASVHDSESPLKIEAELMDKVAESAEKAANAKKTFAEANKQVADSATKSNGSLSSTNSSAKKVTDDLVETDVAIRKNSKSFKEIISSLDIEENKIRNIKKLIESTNKKGEIVYKVSYDNGSNEIYGKNGKLLDSNIVKFKNNSSEINKMEAKVSSLEQKMNGLTNVSDKLRIKFEALKSTFMFWNDQLSDNSIGIDQYKNNVDALINNFNNVINAEKELEKSNSKKQTQQDADLSKNAYDELIKTINLYKETTIRIAKGETFKNDIKDAEILRKKIEELQNNKYLTEKQKNDSNAILVDHFDHTINNIEQEKSRKQGISDSKAFNKDWNEAIRYNAKFDEALLNTTKIMDGLSTPKELDNDFLRLIDEVDKLDTKLKNCKLDPSEYNKLIDTKTKEYNKKVNIQQNREVEEYNASAEAERIAAVKQQKNVIDELNRSLSRYEKLQKRIANGKALSTDETEAKALLKDIETLRNSEVLSPEKLQFAEERLKDIQKEVADITKRLNESSSNGKSIQDRVSKITSNFNTSKDNANSNEYNHSIDTQLYRDAANAVGSLNDKLSQNSLISKAEIDHASELVLKFSQLAQAEQTLNTQTQSLSDAQKIVNQHLRTMTGTSGEILKQGVFKTGKNGISTLLTTIRDTSGEIKDLKFTYNDSVVSMQNTTKSLETQLIGLPKVFDTLKKKSKELLVYWTANALNPYAIIYRGRRIFNVVKELDDTFTEMRKVSDESVSSLKAYQKESFSTADAVGTTAKQIQNSTADWMRLGESLNEAANSAKISNVLLKVSEFDNIDDATKSLTSMAQAYKELSKTEIVDIINQIGNNFSISTDELATSLQSSAATLKLMGNDLAESVAMVTTANSIMQDPDSVSAGLRTISLRIVGTKESEKELEALGEEVDAFVKDTNSKKQQIIADYTAVASNGFKGFNILDDNGNYKNTYEILSGIADIYKEIVEQDKKLGTNHATALVEELAGKNRSSIASAILSDPEQLKAVKESAENADGSAQEELDKYLDSIDGKLEQLINKAQELASVTFDSDFLKDTISSLTTILNLITKLVNFTGTGSLLSGGAGIAINKMLG